MGYRRRKHTLIPSTLELFEAMKVKAWVHEDKVRHNGNEELREEIGSNLDRVRATGVQGSSLFFGAVLLTAMDRGSFTEEDITDLDSMGQGNAGYILEKLSDTGNAPVSQEDVKESHVRRENDNA